jgi:hypothetical protein
MLIYECSVQNVSKCLNTAFVGGTNTINICLILSTIYIFIPVSGCVGRGPVHRIARGPIMLLRRPWCQPCMPIILSE